jgi:translocation and assembly module TamA
MLASFGHSGRYYSRSALLGAAALILTVAPARTEDANFFDSIADFFNPNRAAGREAPAIDAVPYTVTIEVKGGDSSVKSAVTDASNLESLKDRAPSGAAGLIRRALSDNERITAALYSQGYYGGNIRMTIAGNAPDAPNIFDIVEAARKRGPVPVRVDVDPGPAFTFGEVRILDARTRRPIPDGPSLSKLGLEPGQPALADNVVRAEAILVDFWRDQGHPFARIADKDVVADHAAKKLNVTLLVEPGPVATFGRFTVSGADFLTPGFIEDRIEIPPGTPYAPERLTRLRKRLLGYQAIASVRIREGEQLDREGRVPVYIEVTPREQRYIGFAAKYSSTDGSSLNGFWGHRNLFGGGETLRLDATVSWFGQKPEAVPDADPFGYKLAASFVKPGIYTAQDDLIANAAILREVTNAYVREGVTALVGIRHRFDDTLSVQVGLDFEQAQVEDTTGTRDDFVAGVPIDIAYDTTDNALDPTQGIRAAATVEPFAYLGQSGAGPVMVKGTFATYRALDEDKRYILAGRVSAGSIFGASLYDVPPQRRFYAGGGGSVRGYDYQAASPRDANGDIIGGLSYFEASAELRIKITDTIGVVPFFDMGSAFSSEIPDFASLKYSAGIGLRYYTAIGPLRVDFAVPLNPGPDDGSYGVYVSLGQAF